MGNNTALKRHSENKNSIHSFPSNTADIDKLIFSIILHRFPLNLFFNFSCSRNQAYTNAEKELKSQQAAFNPAQRKHKLKCS